MSTLASVKGSVFFFLSLVLFVGCSEEETNYQPRKHTVEITGMKFKPANLVIHKGDTVVWINKDMVDHDVTEIDSTWASPRLVSEDSWEKVITKSDDYFCSLHVVMKGKLIVVR